MSDNLYSTNEARQHSDVDDSEVLSQSGNYSRPRNNDDFSVVPILTEGANVMKDEHRSSTLFRLMLMEKC